VEAALLFGVATQGSASEIAARMFVAYVHGAYPEREICEMMTWCYAGWTLAELRQFAEDTLGERGITTRLNPALAPVLAWARAQGLQTCLVSASPRAIVEIAAAHLQFAPSEILASEPVLDGDTIEARMHGSVPYGPTKCRVREELMNGAVWLASFGDNVFDLEMLRSAQLGVAVRPKPALRERLPELPFVELVG
ncbi:MAG TPA: HAD family hydrolase, partial [Polyangiaceae bacterium]|nr:HAD family hydrolase [Polyangiaceae bacterium]